MRMTSCFFGSAVIILSFGIDVVCSSTVNFAMLFKIMEVTQYILLLSLALLLKGISFPSCLKLEWVLE